MAVKKYIPLWMLLLGLVLTAINMRSPIVMLGSVAQILQAQMGLTMAHIGYLGAAPMPMFVIGALFAPRLARQFGLETMMIAMSVLASLGILGRVWVGVWGFFGGTLALSLAIGMLNALSAPFIKKHAPNHIALATGVFSLSMSSFAGLCAWVVVPLANAVSWRFALACWAVFGIMAAVVWVVFWRDNTTKEPTLLAGQFCAWRSVGAWQMGICLGLQSLMYYTVAAFLPSVAMSYGMDVSGATLLALVFQLSAPVAIVALSFVIRRGASSRLCGAVMTGLVAVGAFGVAWLPEHLHWWTLMMGSGGSAIFTLMLMLLAVRTSSPNATRELSSMVQALSYTLAFFGPLGLGKLADVMGNWHASLVLLFGLMVINIGLGQYAMRSDKIDL